jgi:hypothetical protein
MLTAVPQNLLDAGLRAHALAKASDLATLSFALVIELVQHGQRARAIQILMAVTPGLAEGEADYVIHALLKLENVDPDPNGFDA